jgi:hypothetical protein
VQQFIRACKQELVKDAPVGSIDQALRRELERAGRERTQLQQQNEQLRLQLARLQAFPTNSTTPVPTNRPAPFGTRSPVSTPSTNPAPQTPVPPPPATRTHTVRGGETAFGIAKRYGITVEALSSANPGVDPRRLRTGQVLKLPAP